MAAAVSPEWGLAVITVFNAASIAMILPKKWDCTSLSSFKFMAGAFLNWLIWACQFRGTTPATRLPTYRHQFWRTGLAGFSLPETLAARGKTCGLWCAGAVGGLAVSHGCSVGGPVNLIHHNPKKALL
jgi:hypothetical protein